MDSSEEDSVKLLAKQDENLKDYQNAFNKYVKLTELNPSYYFYKFKAGLQLFRMKKYDEALVFYKDALKLYQQSSNPKNNELASLHGIIGNCYYAIGDLQSAKKEYEESLKLDHSPKNLKYKRIIDEIEHPKKHTVHRRNNSNALGIVFDLASIIFLIVGSKLPIVSYYVDINGIRSNTIHTTIFSFSYELPGQIIFVLILLSITVFLVLDILVLVSEKNSNIKLILKHYQGVGANPLAVIAGAFILLTISYYDALIANPIGHFIVGSSEHVGVGLFVIIVGMAIYFFRSGFKTNPNYVPYRHNKRKN